MNRLLPLYTTALVACIFVACSPQAPAPQVAETPPSEEADEGGHDGPLVPMMTCNSNAMFNASTTKASLIATHGAENMREERVPWVDSELDAIVMWPDNPAMRAEVLWFGTKSGMPEGARAAASASSARARSMASEGGAAAGSTGAPMRTPAARLPSPGPGPARA